MEKIRIAQRTVLGSVLAILILTILEFPSPVGFETRPQSDVSFFWLAFFLLVLIVEIAAVPMIYKRPRFGAILGILAATLNILQVLADQSHLMQPEAAAFGYSILESAVALVSVMLAFSSWTVLRKMSAQKN